MRAIRVVEARAADLKVVDDHAALDGSFDDPRDVLDGNTPVPYPLRIDDHRGAMLALLEAAGVVRTDERPQSCLLELDLERIAQDLLTGRVATPSLVAGLTDVTADEDVVGE
jgi:hypothetical protein